MMQRLTKMEEKNVKRDVKQEPPPTQFDTTEIGDDDEEAPPVSQLPKKNKNRDSAEVPGSQPDVPTRQQKRGTASDAAPDRRESQQDVSASQRKRRNREQQMC